MPFNSPGYLTFHHTYVETLYLTAAQAQPEAFRVVNRLGAYPTPVNGIGSGITYLEAYGIRNLTNNGFGVDSAISVPNLTTAVNYPAGGTVVAAGAILKNAATNDFYTVPASVTLDNVGTTLTARIANDVAAGRVILVPANLIINNLSASHMQLAPNVYGYQRIIPICTDGIAIVEIATVASAASAGFTATTTLVKDQPLYAIDAVGRVGGITTPPATAIRIGRCLDNTTVPSAAANFGVPAGYVRIKLGSINA